MDCLEYKGNLENPAIFSKKYKNELLNLKGDVGGKSIIKKYLDDLERFPINDEVEMMDIDTRKELENLR